MNTFTRLARQFCRGAFLFIILTSILGVSSRAPAIWFHPLFNTPLRLWHLFITLILAAILAAEWTATKESTVRSRLLFGLSGFLTVLAVYDSVRWFHLLNSGVIKSGALIPLSLMLTFVLVLWIAVVYLGPDRKLPTLLWRRLTTIILWPVGGLFLLYALIFTFGATDYRRKADCAIVLGAKVYRDGRMSLALSDRVYQGIRLYQAGLVTHLIMTGGLDPNGQSEAKVMAEAAIAAGIPANRVLIDEDGRNTRRSAKNCGKILKDRSWSSALIVSHYYHLARCKESFQRRGIRCYTVPAKMTRRLGREPLFLMREGIAYLYYALPSWRTDPETR
jgi:uncharacterized SAM-binding protein YcdF (DUF218 family)